MSDANKRLILVVDDERYRREHHKQILEEAGFVVETENSSAAALVWLLRHLPGTVHAVVTDLMMYEDPDGDEGLKVARAAKELDPAIRVVLVSSFIRIQGPFDAKVSKPDSIEDYQRFRDELQAAVC